MLMLHVVCLDEETLAHRIYIEQRKNKLPGLAQETEDICIKLGIESVHTTRLDPKNFRKVVTQALHKENEKRLLKAAENKTKCKKMLTEKYGRKEYLAEKSISETRKLYKTRFQMMNFAGNFKNDKKFAKTGWLCFCQKSREEESHILDGSCDIYGEIRKKYGDIDKEEDLVLFFSEVLEARERMEEEERSPSDREAVTDGASGGVSPPHAGLGAPRPS